MALRAKRSGEAGGHVIGHRAAERLRAVPIGLVATIAIGICRGQVVVSAHVALGAGSYFPRWRHLVRIREREAGSAVIEHAVSPNRDGVAGRAS